MLNKKLTKFIWLSVFPAALLSTTYAENGLVEGPANDAAMGVLTSDALGGVADAISTSGEMTTKKKKTATASKTEKSDKNKETKSVKTVGYVPSSTNKKNYQGKKETVAFTTLSDRLLFQAIEKQQDGDIKGAIKEYYRIVDINPSHTQARLTLGSLLVKDQQYATAISQLNRLTNTSSKDWRPWFWLGSAQLMLGKLDDAADSLDKALQQESSKAALWIQRALVEQQRDSHRTALQLLAVAEQIEPENSQLLLNMAYSKEALSDRESAISTYRQFLASDSKNTESHNIRHIVMSHLSKLSETE